MVNITGKKNNDPEVRCIKLGLANWNSQCSEVEKLLKNKNSTVILSVRDLILQDPISAKNSLQKIASIVKLSQTHNLAALSREMILVTPFKIVMAE